METANKLSYTTTTIRRGTISQAAIRQAGARFSKVPMINGPVKLLSFTYKIEGFFLHLTR